MNPISDMFIRIKNAQKAKQDTVHVPYSKFKHEIAKVLERTGYVGKVERRGKKIRKTISIGLLYKDDRPVIENVKLLSLSSRRLYASVSDLTSSINGGVIILSTPRGVMTSIEAKKERAGGELLAEIW